MFGGYVQCDDRTTVVQLPKNAVLAALQKRVDDRMREYDEYRDEYTKGRLKRKVYFGWWWKRDFYTVTEEQAKESAVFGLESWQQSRLRSFKKQANEAKALIDLISLSVSDTVAVGVKDFEDIKPFYKAP